MIDPLVPLAALLLLGGGFAEWLVLRSRHAHMVLDQTRDSVADLGLQVRAGLPAGVALASGNLDGIGLSLRYHQPQALPDRMRVLTARARLTLELDLPVRMPAGQRVVTMGVVEGLATALGGQDVVLGMGYLDDRLRVMSDAPEQTRILLTQPRVLELLDRCARNIDLELDLRGARLQVQVQREARIILRPIVELVLELGQALVDAAEEPWRRIAASCGLEIEGVASLERRVLVGVVGGVELRVNQGIDRDSDQPRTQVTATISPMLPGGLRVRARQRGVAAGGVGAGDPVLDSVVDVQATDVAAARWILQQDEVIAPLLEVLHAHPDSYVHPRAVILSMPGLVEADLPALVHKAVALARVLSAAAARSGAPPG